MGRKDVAHTIVEIVLKTNTEDIMYCKKLHTYKNSTESNECTLEETIVTKSSVY